VFTVTQNYFILIICFTDIEVIDHTNRGDCLEQLTLKRQSPLSRCIRRTREGNSESPRPGRYDVDKRFKTLDKKCTKSLVRYYILKYHT
jgi:hypothetical protein